MSDKKSFNLDNDEIDEVLTKLVSGRTVIKSLAEKALSFYRQRKIDFRLYEEYYKSNGSDVKSQAHHYVMNTHGKRINHPDKEKENQDTTDTDNELKKLKLEVKRLKEENRRLCDKLEKTELSSEVNDREEGTEKLKDLSSDIKTIAVKNHEAKNRYREASCEPKVDPDAEDAKPSSTCSPKNLAEKFRQLYEVEWKHAFDDLVQSVAEESLFVQLATVMKEIEKFCTEVGNQQTESIKKHVLEEMTYPKFRLENGDVMGGLHRAIVEEHQQEIVYKSVKELRKHVGTLSIGPLCQIFSNYQTQLLGSSEYLNLFAMKATELLWMMKIQLPPLELEWTYSGFTFDKTKFSVFRDSGNIVKQCIWPAVSRYSEGPLLAKGVILAK